MRSTPLPVSAILPIATGYRDIVHSTHHPHCHTRSLPPVHESVFRKQGKFAWTVREDIHDDFSNLLELQYDAVIQLLVLLEVVRVVEPLSTELLLDLVQDCLSLVHGRDVRKGRFHIYAARPVPQLALALLRPTAGRQVLHSSGHHAGYLLVGPGTAGCTVRSVYSLARSVAGLAAGFAVRTADSNHSTDHLYGCPSALFLVAECRGAGQPVAGSAGILRSAEIQHSVDILYSARTLHSADTLHPADNHHLADSLQTALFCSHPFLSSRYTLARSRFLGKWTVGSNNGADVA